MSSQMLRQKIKSLGEIPEGDTLDVLRRQLSRLEGVEPESEKSEAELAAAAAIEGEDSESSI